MSNHVLTPFSIRPMRTSTCFAPSHPSARDINDMMRGQRDRAVALQSVSEIAEFAGRKPLSLAMEEIARGEVSYDKTAFMNDRD